VAHKVAFCDYDVMFLKSRGNSFHRHALFQKSFNDLEGRTHDQRGVILLGEFNFCAENCVDFGANAVHDSPYRQGASCGVTGGATGAITVTTRRLAGESIAPALPGDTRIDRKIQMQAQVL
jgi:hypothetical protein